MARFRYSMQSILDIKLKMETQAKQEFSAARAALDEEEAKLAKLVDRKRAYEREATRLRSGTLNFRDMNENKTAIQCMDNFILDQKLCVKKAEDALEQARIKLAETPSAQPVSGVRQFNIAQTILKRSINTGLVTYRYWNTERSFSPKQI